MNIKEIAELAAAHGRDRGGGGGAAPWSSDPAESRGGVFAQAHSAPGFQRRGSSTVNSQRFPLEVSKQKDASSGSLLSAPGGLSSLQGLILGEHGARVGSITKPEAQSAATTSQSDASQPGGCFGSRPPPAHSPQVLGILRKVMGPWSQPEPSVLLSFDFDLGTWELFTVECGEGIVKNPLQLQGKPPEQKGDRLG